ncbi:MAG: TetR/AcrR family transcriptional regulator [Hyphomicrobiales bacterium]|nr:TetR/AcrR family transcriptional regulator [Hyphomicrobiales bacterium]MCP5370269.1 TetR/AcrR family transcriptional regulator [Hyphomicrobiales bacterium]
MTAPKGRKDKADASRVRILDAAAALFRERGFAAVSLRAIAAAAGMQAGSVYYHFESKEQIVVEVLNLGIAAVHRAVAESVAALPTSAAAAEVIGTGIRSHFRALFQFSAYTSANVRIYGQVPAAVRAANLPVRRGYEALWDGILDRAAAAGAVRPAVDRRAFRLMLIGSINATLEWFDPDRGDVADLAGRYAAILLHGLLQPGEDAAWAS